MGLNLALLSVFMRQARVYLSSTPVGKENVSWPRPHSTDNINTILSSSKTLTGEDSTLIEWGPNEMFMYSIPTDLQLKLQAYFQQLGQQLFTKLKWQHGEIHFCNLPESELPKSTQEEAFCSYDSFCKKVPHLAHALQILNIGPAFTVRLSPKGIPTDFSRKSSSDLGVHFIELGCTHEMVIAGTSYGTGPFLKLQVGPGHGLMTSDLNNKFHASMPLDDQAIYNYRNVYTDGSGFGGVGVYWGEGSPQNISSKIDDQFPNNEKTEVMAVFYALCQVTPGQYYKINTDSKNVYMGVQKRMHTWNKWEWKKRN